MQKSNQSTGRECAKGDRDKCKRGKNKKITDIFYEMMESLHESKRKERETI